MEKLERSRTKVRFRDMNKNAQLEKKRDEDTTLQDFDGACNLQCMEMASQFLLTPSKLEGDDVTISSDAVTVADLKKLIEDLAG
nr:hypothetical protein [Tanacetum cinerariifolium]